MPAQPPVYSMKDVEPLDFKQLNGMKCTLMYIEENGIGMLSAIDKNKNINIILITKDGKPIL